MMTPEKVPSVYSNYLEDYWPFAGELSAVNERHRYVFSRPDELLTRYCRIG